MDRIKIQNLEVFGHHGVFSEETKLGQKFLVNATLYTIHGQPVIQMIWKIPSITVKSAILSHAICRIIRLN